MSERTTGELNEEERRYEDGTDPRVLDIIDVPLREAAPETYQSENWQIDTTVHWARRGAVAWEELSALAERPGQLWMNNSSTFHGKCDRVAKADADNLTSSLYLLRLKAMEVRVFVPGAAFQDYRRRVQGAFEFNGLKYAFWVTDPIVERQYLKQADGTYGLGECFVTVSLGEPSTDGFCYKLIAAIILPERGGGA